MDWRINTKSAFLRSVVILSSGTVIAQVISYIATPIITRLFTPEELGILGWFMRIVTLLATVATIRYELALPLPKKDGHAFQLLRSTVRISLLVILLFVLGTIVFWLFTAENQYLFFYSLVGVAGLLMVLKNIGTSWSIRVRHFKIISIAAIVTGLFTNVLKVIAGKLNLGEDGLIWSTIIGLFFGALVFLFQLLKFKKKNTHKYSIFKARILRKEHQDFPKVNLPHTIVDQGREVLIAYFLILLFDEAVFGSYEQAFRLLKIPLILVGTSIGQVFFNRISELKQENKSMLPSLKKTTVLLTGISILPFLIIYFYGDIIFEFVLGVNWNYAGQIAQTLAPWLMINFIASPISTLPLVLNKQKVFFWIGLGGTILQLIGFGLLPQIFSYSNQEVLLLFEGISWTMFVFHLFVLLFKFKIVRDYEEVQVKN